MDDAILEDQIYFSDHYEHPVVESREDDGTRDSGGWMEVGFEPFKIETIRKNLEVLKAVRAQKSI